MADLRIDPEELDGLLALVSQQAARIAELEAENQRLRADADTYSSAIIAMADDGWLYHGPEGMSEIQQQCYDCFLKIKGIDAARGGK